MPSEESSLGLATLRILAKLATANEVSGGSCVLRATFTLVCGTLLVPLLLLLGQAETEVWHFCVVRQINVGARKGSLIGLPPTRQ